jgi:hypothetical protein
MKKIKKILLIGPGASLGDFNLNDLKEKTTLYFGTGLKFFEKNNIYPTYFTFLDPNGVLNFYYSVFGGVDPFGEGFTHPDNVKRFNVKLSTFDEKWVKGLKENTDIIYNNLQGTQAFYGSGFSTSRGHDWNVNTFGKEILPKLSNCFKNVHIVDTIVCWDTYQSLLDDNEVKGKKISSLCPIVRWNKKDEFGAFKNTDKFCSYIIPLIISQFSNVKTIECIGFGDFGKSRLYEKKDGEEDAYRGFKEHFDFMKDQISEILEMKKIKIKFLSKDSYYKELEK